MVDPNSLPEVPKQQRPKRLYVAENLTPDDYEQLHKMGWEVVDVRLLPNETDAERAEALKGWLEGIRMQTIEMNPRLKDFIEMEMKVYKLLNQKGELADTKQRIDKEDLDQVLSIQSERAFKGTFGQNVPKLEVAPVEATPKRGRGRPRKNP